MVKVPTLITSEECVEILKKHFEDDFFDLVDYSVKPLSEGVEGFLGEHYIITAKVTRKNQTIPVSFFAKIPPLQHDLMMEYVRSGNAFQKEEYFYEVLMKDFKRFYPEFDASIVPKFYLGNNSLVVMENLQEKGFKVAPFKDTMDAEHIKLILKALSKLHSASLIYEERSSGRIIQNAPKEMLSEGFFQSDPDFLGHKWHVASRRGVISTLPLMDIPNKDLFKKKFLDLTDRCVEIVKPIHFRNVISHGDLWLKNVLFRYEKDIPVEVKLIDLQLMKYNPPAFDVLKIIYQSTTCEDRQKHFVDFISYYYDCLTKELILGDLDPAKVLSKDDFLASVRFMLPQCKVETLYYYTFQKFGPEFLKELMGTPEDFGTFGFDDRSKWMLEYYKPGSVYKKWVDEMMGEIKDMLLNGGITREDCYFILRRRMTSNYTLVNYEAVEVTQKTGFVGQYYKLSIEVSTGEKHHLHRFFVKVTPQHAHSSFAIDSGAFPNEIFIYDKIFSRQPSFHECVPDYFYSRRDIVVLEDLEEGGFRLANKRIPFDLVQIGLVIKTLAKFHASSLILEEKGVRMEDLQKNLKETMFVRDEGHLGTLMIKCALKGISKMVDIFPDGSMSKERFMEIFQGFFDKEMYEQVAPSKRYRNVLCHGDLWANNILLKHDPIGQLEDCRFVDLQVARVCPPAHDLISLIYLTTTRDFRQKHLQEILQMYYHELGAVLKNHSLDLEGLIPSDSFLKSCHEYKIYGICIAAVSFPFVMLSSEDMNKMINDEAMSKKIWFEDCRDFIEDTCKRDGLYRKILEESMMDLRDLCRNHSSKYIIDH